MKRLFLIALLLCAGCSGKSAPSFDTVMKLHDGQTYAQVMEIMGKPDAMDAHQFDIPSTKGGGTEDFVKYAVRMSWAWRPHTSKTLGVDDGVDVILTDGLVTQIYVKGVDVPKEYKQPWTPMHTK